MLKQATDTDGPLHETNKGLIHLDTIFAEKFSCIGFWMVITVKGIGLGFRVMESSP
jgi:hypothetical protein